MPKKPDPTEAALDRIREIRNGSGEPSDLVAFLGHRSNHVIAAAAVAAKRLEAESLAPDLAAAFLSLFPHAPERDKGCKAMIAIAEALVGWGEHRPEVYQKGVRHVQREGSFGPPVDVAAPLRGLCSRGLVRVRHPDAMYEIVNLLVDKEPGARVGAVRALEDSGSREAELLARLKCLQGDREEDVLAACFSALLAIAPAASLPFVAQYLTGDLTSLAALAIGESRLEAAFPYLEQAWERHRIGTARRTILLGIAMLRDARGVEFLLKRLEEDSASAAPDTLEALALYRSDDTVHARAQAILERRGIAATF